MEAQFRLSKGFTLVEVSIVVAIGGVLLFIALPAYLQYQGKSKVAAALSELSTLKTNYEIALNSNIDTPTLSDVGAGVMNSVQCVFSLSGQALSGAVTLSCTLTNVPSSLAGGVISYVRSQTGIWTCSANSSVASSFLPVGCSSSS